MKAKRYNKLEETSEINSQNQDEKIEDLDDADKNIQANDEEAIPVGMVAIEHKGKDHIVPKHIAFDIKNMRECVNQVNRRLPRRMGRTLILAFYKNNEPMLTIGPHVPMSFCLIITIIVLSLFFTHTMFGKAPLL